MPMLKPAALSVLCALSVVGCAGFPEKQADPPPAMEPVQRVRHGPVTGEGMYRLGRYLEGQGRRARAIAAYQEALRRDPLLVDAYTRLGMALAAERRYDEAIRQFQAAVVLEPKVAYTHNNLGFAYLLSGSPDLAAKALEEATRLDPGHEKAHENLRVAQEKLGKALPRKPTVEVGAAATVLASEPAQDLSLVEVAPHVFVLRSPVRRDRIEWRPLEAVPPEQPPVAPPRRFGLEISNGNGVLGLAKRVAGRLEEEGMRATRITNQRPFVQARTEVQYREGYDAEASRLAGKLQQPVVLVATRSLAPHVDVRLVLGRDAPTASALVAPGSERRTITAALTLPAGR